MTSTLRGGAGGGRRSGSGRGNNGGRRGNNNNNNNNKGSGRGSNGNGSGKKDGKGGKHGSDIDKQVCEGINSSCAKDNKSRAEAIKRVYAWYAELLRATEPVLKKLTSKEDEENRKAMDCLPASVKMRVEDFRSFLDTLGTHYVRRLDDLFELLHQEIRKEAESSAGYFSNGFGQIIPTLNENRLEIETLFNKQELWYYGKPLRTFIKAYHKAMWTKANDDMRTAPSDSFREAYYNVTRKEFYFLWSSKNKMENRVIVLGNVRVSPSSSGGTMEADVSSISFNEAQMRFQNENIFTLSHEGTQENYKYAPAVP
jgi:hypothetical protein